MAVTRPQDAGPPSARFEPEGATADPVFWTLDRRYRPLIRALALSMEFSVEDAEDIVQETFIDLFLGGRESQGDVELERSVYALADSRMQSRRRGLMRRSRLHAALARDALATRDTRRRRRGPREVSASRWVANSEYWRSAA